MDCPRSSRAAVEIPPRGDHVHGFKARAAVVTARAQLKAGADPSAEKRRAKVAAVIGGNHTFGALAKLWYDKQADAWLDAHAARQLALIERDLGGLSRQPVTLITARDVLTALRRVEARGAIETAHRGRRLVEDVFGYAIAAGIVTHNPARDIAPALAKRPKAQHRAAR